MGHSKQINPYIPWTMSVIDPFLANVPIPHSLRTPENQRCNFYGPQVEGSTTKFLQGTTTIW